MIKEIILIIGFMAVADAVLCQLSTCLSFQCGTTYCPDGYRVKVGGGFCGCCNNCVKALSEGEACNPEIRLGNYPRKKGVTDSTPMCDYGLMCDKNTSKCVKSDSNEESIQDNSQHSSQVNRQDSNQDNRQDRSQDKIQANRNDSRQDNSQDNRQDSNQDNSQVNRQDNSQDNRQGNSQDNRQKSIQDKLQDSSQEKHQDSNQDQSNLAA